MALRPILEYPDPLLKVKALPVERFDAELERLVEDMAETMYAAPGVGLAAPQIGVGLRIFVIDVAAEDEPSQFRAYINPELVTTQGTQTWTEGCLSFPGVSAEIKRAAQVTVRAQDTRGEFFEQTATGLLAVALQHENDHLNGVLMIDKVGPKQKLRMGRELAAQRSAV